MCCIYCYCRSIDLVNVWHIFPPTFKRVANFISSYRMCERLERGKTQTLFCSLYLSWQLTSEAGLKSLAYSLKGSDASSFWTESSSSLSWRTILINTYFYSCSHVYFTVYHGCIWVPVYKDGGHNLNPTFKLWLDCFYSSERIWPSMSSTRFVQLAEQIEDVGVDSEVWDQLALGDCWVLVGCH